MYACIVWSLFIFPLLVSGSDNIYDTKNGRKYIKYSMTPGSPVRAFAYMPGVVALVSQESDKGIVVQMQRIANFERTAPFVVKETAHPNYYRVDGCFERSGKSYLLAYDTSLNETVVIKGQEELVLPLRNYDLLRYDNLEDTIYLVRNRTLLQYRFDEILRYNDIGEPQSAPMSKEELDDAVTDLLVVGGQRYAIFNQAVNRQTENGSWVRVMPTKSEHFWFQIFPSGPPADSSSTLSQISPTSIVFLVEIFTLLFAVYCLNMRLKLRPQTGMYELSRGTPPVERA